MTASCQPDSISSASQRGHRLDRGHTLKKLAAHFAHTPLNGLRFFFFILAIVVYGLCGTPTPDGIGLVEASVALLLIGAIGLQGMAGLLMPPEELKRCKWWPCARLVMFFGLSIPLTVSLIAGNPISLILRDLTAFLFMMLPLLAWPLVTKCAEREERSRLLIFIITLAGLCLAARDIAGLLDISLYWFLAGERLSYLSNSPLVLMSAIILGGMVIRSFFQESFIKAILKALGYSVLMCIPLCAMAMGLQRASLGLFGLSMMVILAIGMWYRPQRAFVLIGIFILAALTLAPLWMDISAALFQKSQQVGLNMRSEELKAVWDAIRFSDETGNIDPLMLLFGLGWGGTFQSPAVGMMQVNYTHGLLSSALLKTGLAGLVLTSAYLLALAGSFVRYYWITGVNARRLSLSQWIIALALFCPFMIDLFLYAAFKSFDFGILLFLMAVYALRMQQEQAESLVKTSKVP